MSAGECGWIRWARPLLNKSVSFGVLRSGVCPCCFFPHAAALKKHTGVCTRVPRVKKR